ncbi:transcription initiation factor TFIIIB, Bdp1 subunit [Phanerochaete sordida]|uniref:Transcription initiation factor TFIIIB, Bdp1 subunit n=1 Tax=Phanerochaete sordida TaxID=48140 RepID=A0A9P3L895_9APHY|nr:transcription initiation factor TFIIIB, Bdp1 subunit [Phanerochaete sordida]
MPPPSTIPQKPPSLTWVSPEEHAAHPAPTPVTPKPSQPPQIASAIATPSRTTARPPAVQITPTRPAALPARQDGPSPTPNTIAIPSRYAMTPAPAVASSSAQSFAPPIEDHVQIPDPFPLNTDFTSSNISDAQIDPALLEAVVTALRQTDGTNQPPLHDSTTDVLSGSGEGSTQARRSTRSQGAGAGEDGPEQAGRTRLRKSSTGEGSSQPARRRRSATATTDAPDGEDGEAEPRRKRTRRSRAPSLPPYDPEADPGEELDPTAVTMAELCDDTGRGRVSAKAAQIMSNHAAWRQANRERRARQRAVAEAKKYGRNLDDEENAPGASGPSTTSAEPKGGDSETPAVAEASTTAAASVDAVDDEDAENQKGDDYDYTQNMATSRFNVQVRIGPNGETIIDETSLFVDRQEEDETANYTHIEESDTTKFVNSSTYSKKLRGSRWSAEETELFYDALQQFGENYELISYIMPGRDRKACKNKFKAEDKRNPNRITWCLKNRRPYDMQTLSRMTGKDFSGPTPVIKAPTPPSLDVGSNNAVEEQPSAEVRKQSATPEVKGNEEEILGAVDDEQ